MTNWYDNVPAPTDANGREVALDTRELVHKGETRGVLGITYNVGPALWVVILAGMEAQLCISVCTVPDRLERLEWDALKKPCRYFGMGDAPDCNECPTKTGSTETRVCHGAMTRDIVRRAKALAGVTDGE